jgi:hypothetical protein
LKPFGPDVLALEGDKGDAMREGVRVLEFSLFVVAAWRISSERAKLFQAATQCQANLKVRQGLCRNRPLYDLQVKNGLLKHELIPYSPNASRG